MKKILLVLSLVFSLGLVGCSSGSEYKDVSTSTIQKAIESSGLLVEKSMPFDIKEFDYFNDVNEQITEGFIIRAAMNIRLEDVIVVKTTDADKVYSVMENYKKDMIERPFGDGYGAEENADIAASTIVEKKGNYVYLISAKNVDKVQDLILEKIKK